ncbi:MAG: M48 family metallopeptidase [Chlamydiae bacterium]|nr:M48 family metallopeptidase [Chlamydiota bacterium]
MENNKNNTIIYSKSKCYVKIKRIVIVIDFLVTFIYLLFIQISGLSLSIYSQIKLFNPNFYIQNMLFVVVFIIISTFVFLPSHYYSQFYLEHRFQLSKQTLRSWFWDGTKSFFLNLIFSIVCLETVYFLLKQFSKTWWILGTLFYFLFTLVLSRLAPTFILPLFYKLKPLEDTALVERLKALSEKAGAKIIGVFQMNMSRKTKKANAMFTGIGKSKRIILGDTLLSNFKPDEIETVLAHELGHYYHKHIWRLIFLNFGTTLLGFFLISRILSIVLSTFGIFEIANIAGLPTFLLILFLFFLFVMPLQNGYSRKLERQADQFSLERTQMPDAFVRAMQKLAEQNLSEINPHPWIEFLLYDHPSIRKRIEFAINLKSKNQNAK